MAEFHFVEDYVKLVDSLIARYPLDEAMSYAVGGAYEGIGAVELEVLRYAGLRDGSTMLDLGCGSGRLAHALGKSGLRVDYTGVDIVKKLLDYAAKKSPGHFKFVENRSLSIPARADSLGLVCAFSVFTHLLHHETYIYLEDIFRALKPGGVLVFSFLEFAAKSHWPIFLATVEAARQKTSAHLNSFMERDAISTWASKLNFTTDLFLEPDHAWGAAGALGQTTAILRKPKN